VNYPPAALLPEPLAITRLARQARRLTTPCGGGAMVWHVWGKAGGAAPLVLLHGASGSWTHWLRNIDALAAAGREVWAADLPGFGDSAVPPDGQDADAMVAPLADGLAALLGGRACDLVGFSFGGLVAGLCLAAHPALARRLVLVGAPAMGVVPQRQVQLRGWRHLPEREAQLAAHRHNLAVLMLSDARLIDDDTLALHVGNVVRDRLPRRRQAGGDMLARALRQGACPVHAIYGAQDALYQRWIADLEAAYRQAAGARFAGLQLLPGCGHWVQYEQPQAFHAALARALGDQGQ
jgi:pimeloyl-ACP methyl ester carboxylesterase